MNHRSAINWKHILMPAVTVLLACLVTGANAIRGRLDRQNLLEFRNNEGAVVPVRSVRDWQVRRAEILAGAQAVMGPLPGPSKRVAEIPFDFHELIGALAPRALFVNAPVGDSNYKWQSVDRIIAAAFQVYQLYGVPGVVRVEHPDVGHSFPPEIRELAYEWIERFR